jgi:FtsP/CotA-like multicopper oxidase with cupredoxin domain
MRTTNMNKKISVARLLLASVVALWLAAAAHATAPGITSTGGAVGTFNLTAQAAYISQPDGQSVYSWGYGCTAQPPSGSFVPSNLSITPFCNVMQVPGPTLVVTEGITVTVNLTNNLPVSAGNTSIVFTGFTLTGTTGGVNGLVTQEAGPNGGTVQYQFVATTPGTHAYYSGTQSDLQVEMGLYGAIIVLPSSVPGNCTSGSTGSTGLGFATGNGTAEAHWAEADYRLTSAAYDNAKTCYDREYLFQFSEMDPTIHKKAEQQVAAAAAACVTNGAGAAGCSLEVPTEPYHPGYFLINGRSMPDDMDPNYASEYPHQPYNGDPHMHPGEQTLIRVIGQGRWQHPFHEHGNHVRILGRDGNLILAPDATNLAGPLFFTTTTTPGLAFDGIFYWTGKGLNWDAYGHKPVSSTNDLNATLSCTPDANGYNTADPTALNYYEWCQDHDKPLEVAPFGDVASGGPATLPDPNLFTNGPWYSGSPYLGPDATSRATFGTCSGSNNTTSCSTSGTTPPSGTIANSPSSEAGYAFMWHSHNEREITTNNVFPGGMLMMMLVDSREFVIDETN